MAPPEGTFRFRHPVQVRFADVDGMGHAHHAVALVYFEEARWAYWAHVVAPPSIDRIEYVMAEARVQWHARIHWPQQLTVAARVSRVGGKHFAMQFLVESPDGTLLASGSSVQVMYDVDSGSSVPLGDEARARLVAFDGPFDAPE